jgi:RiboL-PSP-HEPN
LPTSSAFASFQKGFAEVRKLLGMAEKSPLTVEPGELLSLQQILTRAAIVLLCSHLEAFFEALSGEYVDSLPSATAWPTYSVGVKSFISIHVRKELQAAIDAAGPCTDEHLIEGFRSNVSSLQRWFDDIEAFRTEISRPWLRGFYKENGSKAVDRLLRRLRPDKDEFFDWLEQLGHDRSRFWVSLEGLVGARNDIAHGDATISSSVGDVRAYAAVCIVMVRQACRFIQ